MIYESQEELDAGVAKWAKVLRLQDWDIKICIKRQSEMSCDQVNGENRWTLSNKESLICLLDPVDYPKDCRWEQDHEQTLVHELLHLHLAEWPVGKNGKATTAEEQAICCLADALVKLDRWEMSVPTVNGQVSFAEKREKVKA